MRTPAFQAASEQVTCRKPTAIEAEQAGEIWGERWVDRHAERFPAP